MSAIYQHLLETLKKTDTKQDLDWYTSIYGTDAKLFVPEYEVSEMLIMSWNSGSDFVIGFLSNCFSPIF